MEKPETIMIDNVKYIREDSVKIEEIVFTGEESIATIMIGKPVIVRSRNEGVNAGIVVIADETGVVLKNCRRLYYHEPLNKELSWYEGIAESGISNDSKVSCTIEKKVIIENYSMTEVKKEAYETILNLTPNGQN